MVVYSLPDTVYTIAIVIALRTRARVQQEHL